ncbi:hypothetical protein ACIA59_28800 [Micromonospora haikouensis]|uniref:hypothetical protein n=1 Tax=Micromonospora haikouensis TaxID=686309 RepID=UPI0037B336C1
MTHIPRRRLAATVTGALLLTACQTTPPADPRPAAPPPGQPASTAAVAAIAPGLAPGQRLEILADNIRATPADTTTGPYTYVHTQSWARVTNTIVRIDLRHWRCDSTGSGHEIERRLPPLHGVHRTPQPRERRLFAQADATLTRYPPGELAPYIAEPVPTDPTALAAALAPPTPDAPPAAPRTLVNGVVGMARSQHLNRDQRTAVLRVLAGIPGITYHGQVTDVADRPGLGFRLTTDGNTLDLVIDTSTGAILAAQDTVQAGSRPGLFSYVLFLTGEHTNSTSVPSGAHEPSCPAASTAAMNHPSASG